jgi:excisionase family DNA binding protein
MSPLLHKVEGAMERLNCSRTTVYEKIASGELESVKVGRSRRIPEAALVEYVERLRAQSNGAA